MNPIIHEPRKVAEYRLFTLTGLPVYKFGRRGFTLTQGGNLPAYELESVDSAWSKLRVKLATEQTGQPCEWRQVGETEIMDVSF